MAIKEETREEKKERYYNNSLNERLKHLLKVLEPGREIEWGSYSESRIMALVMSRLAEEYHLLTGMSIIDGIKEISDALITASNESDDSLPL